MSVRVMAEVLELDLPKPEKFLALALANFADDAGGNVYPSVARLAYITGDTTRNVRRLLRRLENRELLEVIRSGGGRRADGRGYTTRYRLITTNGDKLPPFEAWKLSTTESTTRTSRAPKEDTTRELGGHHGHPTRH